MLTVDALGSLYQSLQVSCLSRYRQIDTVVSWFLVYYLLYMYTPVIVLIELGITIVCKQCCRLMPAMCSDYCVHLYVFVCSCVQ